jgi:hypothetical protein
VFPQLQPSVAVTAKTRSFISDGNTARLQAGVSRTRSARDYFRFGFMQGVSSGRGNGSFSPWRPTFNWYVTSSLLWGSGVTVACMYQVKVMAICFLLWLVVGKKRAPNSSNVLQYSLIGLLVGTHIVDWCVGLLGTSLLHRATVAVRND